MTDRKAETFYDLAAKKSDGKEVKFTEYKGKVVLAVNVASQCGYTDGNYKQLTDLYSELHGKGLEILAFPCNQFGKQEPDSDEKIEAFVCKKYSAAYPIFSKIEVNGDDTHAVYKYLKSQQAGDIKWNFEKFLIDKSGKVVGRFPSKVNPKDIDIKSLL